MADFLLTAMPFTGHVTPMTAISAALVDRGHQVRFYTGSAFRDRVEATGARFVPWRHAPDFDEQDLSATFPRLMGRKGLAQLLANMEDLFIATAPGQLADVRTEWRRRPWEVLVSEEVSYGPPLIAHALGCHWATVAILPLNLPSVQGPPPMGLRPGGGPLGRARDAALRGLTPLLTARLRAPITRAAHEAGLHPPDTSFDRVVFSKDLILASGVAALDHDRTDRPGWLHWVGRLAHPDTPPTRLPSWWDDLAGRRVIHVTQGTQNVDPTELLRPALEALEDIDAIVVASTGVRGREALPFPLPANARVASFLPYDQLLPRTELVVTNGGWGGVLATLAHGIPLVVGGGDLDKPEVAARVASSGAGVNLRSGRPHPHRVRAAVERVRTDPGFAAAARRIARQLGDAGGSARAAQLLEAFAAQAEGRAQGPG